LALLASSVSASNGLRDHFSHRLGPDEIFIDGLGPEQAILTPFSRISRMQERTNMRAHAADVCPALFPQEMETPDR
jgi:hypothetical protein